MVTAFGYDWVPGNLAGALALSRAGEAATRVDTGYFITGDTGSMSGGTRASLAGVMSAPAFAFRDGRVQSERGARRVRSFRVGPKELSGVSVGTSEHFALPRLAPGLREVNSYLGWFGPATRAMQVLLGRDRRGDEGARRRPALGRCRRSVREGLHRWAGRGRQGQVRLARGGDRLRRVGPRALAGARVRSGRVHVHGQDPGLGRRAGGRGRQLQGTGALGPADGFGLEALVEGCRQAGISEDAHRIAGQAGRGARRRRLSGRVHLSARPRRAAPAARARAAPAALALWRWASRWAPTRTTPAQDERPAHDPRPRSSPWTPSPCAGRSVSCSCRASTARPCRAYMRRRLRAGETAGVILFGGNAGTASGWRALTRGVQRAARGARARGGGPGGRGDPHRAVRRTGAGTAGAGESRRRACAGPRCGQPAEELGVNVNLAPVADVATAGAPRSAAGPSRAGRRRWPPARQRPRQASGAGGVAATAKHFPGLGAAAVNTDDGAVTIAAPRAVLEARELVPFRAAVRARVPLVMLSHALYPALDGRRIASQSPAVDRRAAPRAPGLPRRGGHGQPRGRGSAGALRSGRWPPSAPCEPGPT